MDELKNELFAQLRASRYWLTVVWNRYDWSPRVHFTHQFHTVFEQAAYIDGSIPTILDQTVV